MIAALAAHAQREGRWSGRYEGPIENFAEAASLKGLGDELANGRFAEAARLIDGHLQNSGDRLMGTDDGAGLVTVTHWIDLMIDGLPAAQRKALEEEYRKQFDIAARGALESARKDEGASYETLYAVGRRYRLSSVAGTALAGAAERAVRIGDAPAAMALYDLAQREGWKPEPSHGQIIEACRKLVAEEDRAAPAGQGSWRGPITFDAAWYGRAESSGMAKHFFYAADGVTYAIGPRHVLALKEDGQTAWRWAAPETWAGMNLADRAPGRGRAPTFAPAVFVSAAGPQILVARQPRGTGRDFVLRAWRASDGKLLWGTDQHAALESIALASAPLICGRYIYCSAVEYSEDSATLTLAAIDLLDGRLIFKSPLGSMLGMKRSRSDITGWDEFWEQSELAVAGDTVYLTPNAGAVMAVGRFDGRLRWIRPYQPLPVAAERIGRREGDERLRTRREPPREPAELLRYRGTPWLCGDVLVAAPQDTAAVLGLDRSTGKLRWRLDKPPGGAHTLVAGTDQAAIFAGSTIQAVDARTGEVKWKWEPAGAKVSGPPALAGGALYVPSTDLKITALDPATGRLSEGKAKQPNFRQLVASEAGKKALEEATILRTLGLPGTVGRN